MGEIAKQGCVYVDTNILIRLVEGPPEEQRLITEAIQSLESPGVNFVTSELTLAEVMVIPVREQDEQRISIYEAVFEKYVRLIAISRNTLMLAAKLRADTPSQRMPDAIHVATATILEAGAFVTGDRGIKNVPKSMKLIVV